MGIIVQKFGGTSVADAEKIMAAARKAIRAQKQGHQVVMVVSAMGHTTDHLVDLARQVSKDPPAREMDMLLSTGEQVSVALVAMAIHSMGHKAISMTGPQLGIRTDNVHTKARIRSIDTERIRRALDEGNIVIAAGFQGISDSYDITTLGRGGSDTTAVALAAALQAEACEIYTDVDGVYTTDPRKVPDARRMSRISYDEMLELATAGAGVMHNRSIEFAKRFSVPVHVRHSGTDQPGTIISWIPESTSVPVCGAAVIEEEARITVEGVPDRPGAAASVFTRLSEKNIEMDMIVQNMGADGRADLSFTVALSDLPAALRIIEQSVEELGAEGVGYDENIAKVSVVGSGMANRPGVAEKMFEALASKGINILMITTSEIKISVAVDRKDALEALRTLHEAFELDKEPPQDATESVEMKTANGFDRDRLLSRMQGMEDLLLEGISLDETQSRVTLPQVPDRPGLAASVFKRIAEKGISGEMIVQNACRDDVATMTFTVPRTAYDDVIAVARDICAELKAGPPTGDRNVAKLSIQGTGLKSHVTVAGRTFAALSRQEINADMISTSEVRLNIVVAGEQGRKGLEALKAEFDDALI
ncbi:MAG: aspartate kinase [Planctomycetota bacterium]|nr:MAG: aspartate kinase [Planctomycetota bacterium]